MNIFEALREDHETQRELSKVLIETHGDSDERDKLFQQLKTALKAHAASEERCFYIPLFEDDTVQEMARHSVSEHHEMDEMIDKLEETDYSSPAWLTEAKNLHDRLHHHLDEEEHKIFQMAGKALTETQKTSLAADYKKEMREQCARDW